MDAINKFVEDHSDHFQLLPSGKVQCTITQTEFGGESKSNHETTLAALEKFVSGKKYRRKVEELSGSFNKETIIPHRAHPLKLYCIVCKIDLNKVAKQVENHVQGRKHVRLVAEYEARNKAPESSEDDESGDSEEEDSEVATTETAPEDDNTEFEVVPQNDQDEDKTEYTFYKNNRMEEDDEDDSPQESNTNKMGGNPNKTQEMLATNEKQKKLLVKRKLQNKHKQKQNKRFKK